MLKLNAEGLHEVVAYDPALLAFEHDGKQIRVPFLVADLAGLKRVDPVEAYGFFEVNTGGGCMALQRDLADGRYLLLTDESGVEIPDEDWEACLIGLFNEDGEQMAMCTGIEAYESIDCS